MPSPKAYLPPNTIVVGSDDRPVYPDSWPQTLSYNVDGSLNYVEITSPDATPVTYRQTFTYTGGSLTSVSNWVKQ